MKRIKKLISSHQEWIVERSLDLVRQQWYMEYLSTLPDTWETFIARLTEVLFLAADTFQEQGPKLAPDDTFAQDIFSAYAAEEYQRQSEKGINLAISLGVFKYCRRSYLECIRKNSKGADQERYLLFAINFFDKLEVTLCANMSSMKTDDRLAELQTSNRAIFTERNKLLTLIESLTTPIILLDEDFNVELMSQSAVNALAPADKQACTGHTPRRPPGKPVKVKPLKELVPWLAEAIDESPFIKQGQKDCRFDFSTSTEMGIRHFNISISNISDRSDAFSGYTIALDDITFRIEMERQLALERNRATHYLDIVGSIVVVLDSSVSITLINRTGCHMLGYQEKEVLGQSWIDLIVPREQQDEVRDYLSMVFAGHTEIDDEHINYVTRKDGSHRLISWNNRLLRNEEGLPIGILSSGTDITEQRKAEDALAEKELWLRNTFVALGDAVLILAPDGTVIDVTPAAEKMFQISNEDFMDLPMKELHVDEEQYLEFERQTREAFAQGRNADFEFSMRRRSGEVFPTQHSISLITGDDGMQLGMVSVIRDISDQKKAELRLKRSEKKFRRIFNSIGEGYIVTDLDGRIMMVNPATCSLLGYQEGDLVGQNMEMLYTNANERRLFRQIILSKGKVRGFHLNISSKNGSTIVVEANAHLEHDENGIAIGMGATFRDITKRIEAEKILREREKQYRAFFENNHAIMLLVEPRTGEIVDANPAASNFYGYSCNKMRKMNISEITAQTEEEIYQEMIRAKNEKRGYFVFKHRLANGSLRDVEMYSGPIMVRKNQLLYSVIHDVTQRVRLEGELKKLATTDTLTGIDNRHQFFLRAAQELKRAKRYGHPLTVLMIDIDYFKSINDTHGHQAGDVVLKALAALTLNTLRETDVFGRIGGEEFAAALPDTDLQAGLQVADRLREELAKLNVQSKKKTISFTVSIGAALARKRDKNIEETINRADEALYKAKRMGRNRVEHS